MLTIILYFTKQIQDLYDHNFYDMIYTEETPDHKRHLRVRGISYANAREV